MAKKFLLTHSDKLDKITMVFLDAQTIISGYCPCTTCLLHPPSRLPSKHPRPLSTSRQPNPTQRQLFSVKSVTLVDQNELSFSKTPAKQTKIGFVCASHPHTANCPPPTPKNTLKLRTYPQVWEIAPKTPVIRIWIFPRAHFTSNWQDECSLKGVPLAHHGTSIGRCGGIEAAGQA